MKKAMKGMGKYGIKGNTGLGVGGMFHVSAPYDSNGKVFIRVKHPEWHEVWKRVAAKKADPKDIIRCCMCDQPAVSLDHLWPYHSEMTRCAEHFDTPYSEALDKDYKARQESVARVAEILNKKANHG